MQKNHCLISNIENLFAKIRSVKFSFLLSIFVDRDIVMTPKRNVGFVASINDTDFCHAETKYEMAKSHYI